MDKFQPNLYQGIPANEEHLIKASSSSEGLSEVGKGFVQNKLSDLV